MTNFTMTNFANSITFEMVPPSLSESYLIAARALYTGVELLSVEPSKAGVPCSLLAGQTVECALKCYLAHCGKSEEQLSKAPFGHNLEELWTEAVRLGLTIQPNPPRWCLILNSGHDKPFPFRYPTGLNFITVPALSSMASDIRFIVEVVGKSV